MSEIEFDKLVDNNFEEFIKDNKLADKSLIEFLSNSESYGKKNLSNYQQYLKDTGKATSTFATFTKKAGSVLKSFGATLGSMAVNFAIGKAIDLVVTGIDNLIHSAEHCKERVDELMY